jgi:NAD(P)-dependent dehydrogenase (short-subunit alcohol dehydrogenase family)
MAFDSMTDEDIDWILDIDLRGALLCAQLAIPALRARGGGSIVFTSSVQAYMTMPGCVVYGAAKAGLVAAARALAVEVGRDGIRVNTIAPGTIDTPMLERDLSGMNLAEADSFLEKVRNANALGRIGHVSEIGSVLVFLTSDAAAYVTGTTIVADGGFLAVKGFA